MRYCGYCGAELPEYARFCRMCGSYADGEGKNAIDVINPSPWHVPSPDTPVPLLNVSGLLLPQAQDDETVKKPLPAGEAFYLQTDRKSTRLNSSHERLSRMPSSA